MNFNKQLLGYLDFLNKKFELNYDNISESILISHINKSDKFILFVIYCFLIALNFFSFVFFLNYFSNLSYKRQNFISKLFKPFYYLTSKINDFLLIIISLHMYGNESIDQINISKKNYQSNNYFEFAVIGSGPSGSVIANELNKVFKGKVTLIEKGNYLNIPKTKHPGSEFANKWFRGGLNTTFMSDMIAYSSASCFGGGSEINSGLYHEPDDDFFQNWREEFDTLSLSVNDNRKFQKKVREFVNYQIITNQIFHNKFNKGLNENDGDNKLKKFISSNNKKNSMSKTLLDEFLRNNGKVLLETEVNKIRYDNKLWELEITSKKNNKHSIVHAKHVFLCCGSIFTNNLLLKSNISTNKKSTLKRFSFHPMVKVAGIYEEKVQNLNEDIIPLQNMENYPKYIFGNASSSIQFILSSFFSKTKIRRYVNLNWDKMKIFHSTFSLGSGKIINIPFLKYPFLSYKLSKSDKSLMVKGYVDLIKFIKKTGVVEFLPIGNSKKYGLINISKTDNFCSSFKNINSLQISSVHILGGVTMGEKEDCVADSFGKIKEYENLYVADSSLINTKLLKNPQGTIMMLAYRNIDNFIRNYNN